MNTTICPGCGKTIPFQVGLDRIHDCPNRKLFGIKPGSTAKPDLAAASPLTYEMWRKLMVALGVIKPEK